jgi:hypothetical protein
MHWPQRLTLSLILLSPFIGVGAQQDSQPSWQSWQFLKGKWVGEGSAEVGHGAGYFTFEPDLQDKAWIRRNHSEYPATKDRLKYVHDDIMIVYFDPATHLTRAFYYDTEQHVINYTASLSADGNTLTFLSDQHEGAPRFRLTYIRSAPDQMSLTLETAPPTNPNEFRKIVEGRVRKLGAGA